MGRERERERVGWWDRSLGGKREDSGSVGVGGNKHTKEEGEESVYEWREGGRHDHAMYNKG